MFLVGKRVKAKIKISSSIKANISGSHHGRRSETPMGDFSARESDDLVTRDAITNKSQSNYDLGLVRQG